MKYITILLVFLMSSVMMAQDMEPTFKKEGDMVKATYYHDNGTVAQTGYYLNEMLHGEWVMFDTQGKKQAMGQYEFGQKTGKWFFWSERGLKEVDFANNKVAKVIKYDNAEAIVINK